MPSNFNAGYDRLRPVSDVVMIGVGAAFAWLSYEMIDRANSPAVNALGSVTALIAASALLFPFVDHTNKHPFGKKDVPEAAE